LQQLVGMPQRLAGRDSGETLPSTVSARVAGLEYTTDQRPGIARFKAGNGFRYVSPSGRRVTDPATIARIKALAIPPAWTNVWIATSPQAHLQATGRDARGRKQYRYHARWREIRHQAKYERLVPFARVLPHVRRRVASDLRQESLTKTKVLAVVVQLLERTFIRIGNIEYVRSNRSYGLTTLRDGHVKIRGAEVRFAFKGKSGIRQSVMLSDARLARIVKRCQELPGQELFQYIASDGTKRAITSADVNTYLREVAGADFTAKDFRTWAGTLLAASHLRAAAAGGMSSRAQSSRMTKSAMLRAVERVAEHLGNTAAICRACYIHPAVLEAYADGTLVSALRRARRRPRGLSVDEAALLGLLEQSRGWRQQLAAAARMARRGSRARRGYRQSNRRSGCGSSAIRA
jgi:DNA topoisomerase I